MFRFVLSMLFVLLISAHTAMAAPQFAAQLQAQYAPPTGGMVGFTVETQLDALPAGLSLVGRYGYLSYSFEDGDYWEDGYGGMYGIGVKYYTASTPLEGWYVGVELQSIDVTVDWGGYSSYGTTWIEGVMPGLAAGYHKNLGKLFIEPHLLVAVTAAAGGGTNDSPPLILAIGIGAGVTF
ncbi:MAG: hypothetical protein OEZ43_06425 [Gammaproteobacteria bacterium]|nr:hypothetical protein [Gammaproteobacteria bacterium]